MIDQLQQHLSKLFVLKTMTLAIGFGWSCMAPGESYGAEITRSLAQEEREMGCTVAMRGALAPGDSEKLRKVLINEPAQDPVKMAYYQEMVERLCLDSSGGSLEEAIAIIEMMVSRSAGIVYSSILTAVPQGAVCESACALIFMAGNEYYWSDGVTVHRGFGGLTRLLHPNAKLGFHQRSIIVPDRNFTKDDAEKIFSLGIKSAELLVSLQSQHPSFMNMRLMWEMYTTPSEEMFYIDTVGQSIENGIGIFPFEIPSDLELFDLYANSCTNAEIKEWASFSSKPAWSYLHAEFKDSIISRYGIIFNNQYKNLGDKELIIRGATIVFGDGLVIKCDMSLANGRIAIDTCDSDICNTEFAEVPHHYAFHYDEKLKSLLSSNEELSSFTPKRASEISVCGWFSIGFCSRSASEAESKAREHDLMLIETTKAVHPNFNAGWFCAVEPQTNRSAALSGVETLKRKGLESAYAKNSC